MYLSVVIPAYNEALRIAEPLDHTLRYLAQRAKRNRHFTYEVIVVDGCSKDLTPDIVWEMTKRYPCLRLIQLDCNLGKGGAVKEGVLDSRGELILMVDADGAVDITAFETFEPKVYLISENFTIIHILIKPLYMCFQRQWYRSILSQGFHYLTRMFIGKHDIKDTQCGFKLFTKSAAKKLFKELSTSRWSFDVELIMLCNVYGIPITEVPVDFTDIPGSKITTLSFIHTIYELACIGFNFKIKRAVCSQYEQLLTMFS
ncbi:hypothetical protein SELMODRAFT_101926 [Selaginella moellendorffii]|uniref:dolichyl-phosphate beta-glucosyltransferase n=1 Tax=Selaginella moellendorffii TaxID=88036 RepID=D8RU87_SELML|nr:hypothetical protein SELMODRAFT_101926 [Selaginella moellendorffii]